jgi:hypothetical protein
MSTTEDVLGRKNSGSGLEIREYGSRVRHADHVASSITKTAGINFADKRLSLGRYSLLADSSYIVGIATDYGLDDLGVEIDSL